MSGSISKNILSVYIANFVPAGLTYLFWIIASNFTDSRVVGVVAAIGSFSMILGVLSNFDIGVGMKRFLGKAVADKDWFMYKNIVSVSTLFSFLTSIGVLIIALNPFFDVLSYVGIEKQFIPIIIIIVIGNDLQNLLIGALVSALKSRTLVIPSVIASIARFPVLFILFYFLGKSDTSVAWSYSVIYIVNSIILLSILLGIMKTISGKYFHNARSNLKLVIRGSAPRWIPQIISVLGSQLSILAVFSLKGASESGLFYIPYAIFNVLFLISGAINQVSYPVLSGIDNLDKQKQFLKRTLKITFLGTIPFSAIIFFYDKPILSIFGSQFSHSGDILSILLLSFPFAIVTEGVYYLLFARGQYRNVLALGLTSNVPRILLYVILVPMHGGVGGAIAFVTGTICQIILSTIIIEKMGIRLSYTKFFVISIVPFAIGYLLMFLNVGLLGSVALFIFSWVVYLRLNLFDENDIENSLKVIMEPEKAILVKNRIVKELKRFHMRS